jgi:hypothetical protein
VAGWLPCSSYQNICRRWLFLQLWSFILFKKYASTLSVLINQVI